MAKNSHQVTTSSTTKRARAKKQDALTMNHEVALSSGDTDFDALLSDLGITSDEINEPVITDAHLESAVASAEATEVMMASATPEGIIEGAAPSDGAIAGDEVIEAAHASAEGDAEKVKKERAPRKHYADKIERLKDRMGASLSEYSVLTVDDLSAEDDAALAAATERTLEIIRSMNSKEKNRASNFMEYLSGKRIKLNNVLERVLVVLEHRGEWNRMSWEALAAGQTLAAQLNQPLLLLDERVDPARFAVEVVGDGALLVEGRD